MMTPSDQYGATSSDKSRLDGPPSSSPIFTGPSRIFHKQLRAGRYESSIWSWMSLGCLLISLVLHLVAFCMPGWLEVWTYTMPGVMIYTQVGLWRICTNETLASHPCHFVTVSQLSDGVRATQVFAVFSLLALFTSFFLAALHICYLRMVNDRWFTKLQIIFRILTLLLLVLTVGIFREHGTDRNYNHLADRVHRLAYSYALEVATIVSEFLGVFLLCLHLCQMIQHPDEEPLSMPTTNTDLTEHMHI